MSFQRFWMVLGSGTPRVTHPTAAAAHKEAERLCRVNPGQEFYVLESVGRYVKTDVRYDEPSDVLGALPDLPF